MRSWRKRCAVMPMTKKHGADDDKVVVLDVITRLDIPAERILKGEPYFASGLADGGDILWLIEKCKSLLMNGGYND